MDIGFYRYYARTVEAARGPVGRYDERKCCGVNFNNLFVARRYDGYVCTRKSGTMSTKRLTAAAQQLR